MKNRLIYILGASMVAGSLVFGTVIGIRGSSIAVAVAGEELTYVDTSDADITQGLGVGSTKLSVGSLAVGDKVMIFGKGVKSS